MGRCVGTSFPQEEIPIHTRLIMNRSFDGLNVTVSV